MNTKKIFILVCSITFIGLIIRLFFGYINWLWYDELQSVTHAALPLRDLIKSIRAYDPHPPLYYLQLHFWMFLGTSDLWIKLNSILWSLLTIVSLFFISKKLFDFRVGIIASLLFAILPLSVSYSNEVRMYSFLMFIGIWVYYFAHSYLYEDRILFNAIGLIFSMLIFLYSHGAAFLIIFSVFCYGLIFLIGTDFNEFFLNFKSEIKTNKHRLIRFSHFVFLQSIICIMYYTNWLQHAKNIRVAHLVKPDLKNIIDTFYILNFGLGQSAPDWLKWTVPLYPL